MKKSLLIIIALSMLGVVLVGCDGLKDPRDKKTYKTVKIGGLEWMAENLNYEMENSYCYDGKLENCAKYGRRYTWEAALEACPVGWHLPSKEEFETLLKAVGERSTAGLKLKSVTGWNEFEPMDVVIFDESYAFCLSECGTDKNCQDKCTKEDDNSSDSSEKKESGNGTDAFGFSALPAGQRTAEGSYKEVGDAAYFWNSSYDEYDGYTYVCLYNEYEKVEVSQSRRDGGNAYSVRCVKDQK